jgi:hypothetical protein
MSPGRQSSCQKVVTLNVLNKCCHPERSEGPVFVALRTPKALNDVCRELDKQDWTIGNLSGNAEHEALKAEVPGEPDD